MQTAEKKSGILQTAPYNGTAGALRLAKDLVFASKKEPCLAVNFSLPIGIEGVIEHKFLGATLEQYEESGLFGGKIATASFRSTLYWLEHGRFTRDLMIAYARMHGRNETLYGQLGRIHDADYLMHPHNSKHGSAQVHPTPLANFLRQIGSPAIICAAVMEHAGYIGIGKCFSSRLSAALSACDDLATYAAALDADEIETRNDLCPEALTLLRIVPQLRVRLNVKESCPSRVLNHPRQFINKSFELAT